MGIAYIVLISLLIITTIYLLAKLLQYLWNLTLPKVLQVNRLDWRGTILLLIVIIVSGVYLVFMINLF